MTAIEEKQIKGMTGRLLAFIVAGTISICSTCFYTYYGIKNQIQESISHNIEQDKLIEINTRINQKQDLDISTLNGRIGLIDYRIDKIETKKQERQ